jgi:crotonobetainyl-CoA:carnitine CoA-transferase CaiB-like acyl-CoA transferase
MIGGVPLPLADVRILAVEQYGAGPFGSLHLADLGADVIKIEDPATGGDVGRTVPPYTDEDGSLFFETFNRNKRSVCLDLATQSGRDVFRDLVRVSDAVYSNLRGDVPAALAITYSDLADVNPRIVCCSLSGFGMTGPRAAQPGYDYVLQGLAGWMSLTGDPDGPPTKTGSSLVDYAGGLVAALALVTGLHAARRDGVGMDCDISLFDTAIGLIGYPATWHLTAGFEPVPEARSAHPTLVPFQNFPTADGWIVIACPKEKFWRRLVDALERPELADDPRFATFADRYAHRDEVVAALDEVLVKDSTDTWIGRLTAAGVPCGPVNDVRAAFTDPHTEARDMVVDTEHPTFGTVHSVASPVKVGATRDMNRRAPRLGEDTEAVLTELLHYDDDRIASLRAGGAFGKVGT